jgi:3-phenylpropionate/trans-cinnamate dioxygenase ferredoxin reductase subunit
MAEVIRRILILGAGHAGGTAALLLRQLGFSGQITLIGNEQIAPYQRPPLSKAYLKGEVKLDTLKLKADSFYEQIELTLRLGETAQSLDLTARQVTLATGEILGYDVLIISTGSRARPLSVPGTCLPGVYSLRSAADADALQAALQPGRQLVLIGGGYIGLEAAATARALGASATVVEREQRVLTRVASEPLAEFFTRYHTERGVKFLTGAQVMALEADDNARVASIRLAHDTRIFCDAVLVGIGALSCDELAVAAGIQCANGIVVNGRGQTSEPSVYAIGDVTSRPLPVYGNGRFRLESVANALEQARQAVHAILDLPPPPIEVPWFWSDQYDLKLQIAGLPVDTDGLVIRGSPGAAKFAVFHLRDDRLMCVEAVNSPAEFMIGKRIIGARSPVAQAVLSDTSVPMKSMLAA